MVAYEELAWLIIDKDYPSVLKDKFEYQYIGISNLPEEISNSGMEPGWNEVEIIGRFAPYQVWGATSAEEYSLELMFLAEMDYYYDVVRKVEWLKSLKKPVIHEGVSYAPPPLLFIWGEFINRRVLLKSADPTYKGPWAIYDYAGKVTAKPLYPMQASVSVTLVPAD